MSGSPPPPGPHGAAFWDERFCAADFVYGTSPSLFLQKHANLVRPGLRVLVPADGEGRNGVWLAAQGADVLSVDFSSAGLAKAAALARARGVTLRTLQADLAQWTPPAESFDLIVCVYLHLPATIRFRVHAGFARALAPGGHLILEGFGVGQMAYASGGPRDASMLFTPDRLRADFADLEALECVEEVVELDEGPFHRGLGALVRFLGRKPLSRAPRGTSQRG